MHPVLTSSLRIIDYHTETGTFLDDVQNGLVQSEKTIPSKFFYDARGSRLFDLICDLPEYYLTRTETTIMQRYIGEMVERIGPHCLLVEYGSGSSIKTRILLDHLERPAGYVPIDISRQHLRQSAVALVGAYPDLRVMPVCADYTTDFCLPVLEGARPVVYFPGSTIGNFEPHEAETFLRRLAQIVGVGGGLLIGVDLRKDVSIIEAAYNDAQGVTAAFNKNVLLRINRELGGNFNLDLFDHRAVFNEDHGRIEMHLVSRQNQCLQVGDLRVPIQRDETILTEYSYKYTPEAFAALADRAGFHVEHIWTDDQRWFSVQDLVVK